MSDPVKTKRRIGGIKARAFGSMFEEVFLLTSRRLGIGATRVPDSCVQLRSKIIRIHSPFDWIITYMGKSAFIDTKTTGSDTFSRSDITEHQVKELLTHEAAGGIAGYVIWYRTRNVIFFIPASTLQSILTHGNGPPLNELHPNAIRLGSLHDFKLRELFKR